MGNELTVIESGMLMPVANLTVIKQVYQAKKEFIEGILKDKVDYGLIPGSDKKTLLKPGAEKMSSFFNLAPAFEDIEKVEDWTGELHGGEPFFYYRIRCHMYNGERRIASADGSCNSWEKKYRYRQATRVCPACGQPAIFKSKDKPEWYCWSKKGGCGAKFSLSEKLITDQEVGQVINPDVAEQVNTILKMAQKRALVAVTLIATGTSEYFTQDIEDFTDATFTESESVQFHVSKTESVKEPEPTPEPAHGMTLEDAKALHSDTYNKTYGELSDEELNGTKIGLSKMLKSGLYPPEKQSKLEEKLEAVKLITASRK
jgi:hypothetical protein